MRIAMLSDHERYGGAAIAATRLAMALELEGHDVARIVAYPSSDSTARSIAPTSLQGRAVREFARRTPTSTRVDRMLRPSSRRAVTRELEDLRPDVISLHNIHAAFPLGWSVDLLALADDTAPTVWTLHDMWSFTGRCAYSYDCDQFLSGCSASCPTPRQYPPLAPSRIGGEWAARQRVIGATTRTLAVAPSAWLASAAEAGLWRGRVEHVPHGLPLDEFAPQEPSAARRSLGLRGSGPVLLAAAAELGDPRKGMGLLVNALEQMRHPVTVLTVGHGRLRVDNPSVTVVPFGAVTSSRLQAILYSAADVFVHPAIADNLPLVVQEAIACGTPVVAFKVGGLPEMVRPGHTGWLADVGPDSLLATVGQAIDEAATLRASCRRVAEREWDILEQARRHVRIWENLPSETLPRA